MRLSRAAIDEARAPVVCAGMAAFQPASAAPASTDGDPVPIALITTAAWGPGFATATGQTRAARRRTQQQLVGGLAQGHAAVGGGAGAEFELEDGFHRLDFAAALGYTHLRAIAGDRPWRAQLSELVGTIRGAGALRGLTGPSGPTSTQPARRAPWSPDRSGGTAAFIFVFLVGIHARCRQG